jgi:CBS domain-containing protein/RNA polymerase-binding transcription factor DksA
MPSVAELMTTDPVTVEPDMAAVAALELMIGEGIRHLPVLDRKDRVCGIVSLDDLRAAFPFAVSLVQPPTREEREDVFGYAVGEVMTHGPLTIQPQATLAEAASLLARYRVGCLPVVDAKGRLIGVFTEIDALRALAGQSPEPSSGGRRALELRLLRSELEAERRRIGTQLEKLQEPGDEALDPELEEPLASLAAQRLQGLQHALHRACEGRLGRCEECGREIPIARLRALPGTTRCVRCADAAETLD